MIKAFLRTKDPVGLSIRTAAARNLPAEIIDTAQTLPGREPSVLRGPSMSYSDCRFNRFLTGALWFLLSGLLAGGLSSCGGGGNNAITGEIASQLALTFSPSSVHLTAGAAAHQASLLLAARPARARRRSQYPGLQPGSPSPRRHSRSLLAWRSRLCSRGLVSSDDYRHRNLHDHGQWARRAHGSVSVPGSSAPPPDLRSVNPAWIAFVADGVALPVSVTTTPISQFSSEVKVAITGLPAGVTITPSSFTQTPGPVVTPAMTLLTVSAASERCWVATVTLTATSGTLTHTAPLAITVTAPPARATFRWRLSPSPSA